MPIMDLLYYYYSDVVKEGKLEFEVRECFFPVHAFLCPFANRTRI